MEESKIQNPESRIARRPLALIILDGWGHSTKKEGNAVALANTPYFDEYCRNYPQTQLAASGPRVGLAPDAPGNPEVGHLNLGAGRIVQTDISRISEAISSGEFFENKVLRDAFAAARENKSSVHLIGLLSDGEIHSSPESLFALLRMAKIESVADVFVHAILDGLDVQPRTADIYVEALEIKLADIGVGRVASLCGRYYAMDEDENWERTARAYTMLVHSEGEQALDPITAIRNSFLRGMADEFIQPIILEKQRGIALTGIGEGDVVIFFNHRADGIRQLVKSLCISDAKQGILFKKPRIKTVCLTEYDRSFNLPVAFSPVGEKNVLSRILAERGITKSLVAETDRSAHLTYFFNGGTALDETSEKHIFVPSLEGSERENRPELQSFKLTDTVLSSIEENASDVYVINLAAADIAAQTGNLDKTIESVQYLDTCLGGIIEKIREVGGVAIITSDHGNCEEMVDPITGDPSGRYTRNPVPFILVDDQANGLKLREDGALEDIAPTILGMLELEKPAEMTGRDLREL